MSELRATIETHVKGVHGKVPPGLLELVDEHLAEVQAIRANTDLRKEVVDQKLSERDAKTFEGLDRIATAEIQERQDALDREKGQVLASLKSPGIPAFASEADARSFHMRQAQEATGLQRATFLATVAASTTDPETLEALVNEVALRGDPTISRAILGIAAPRVEQLLFSVPEHQRATHPLLALNDTIRRDAAELRKAHPAPHVRLRELDAARAAVPEAVQGGFHLAGRLLLGSERFKVAGRESELRLATIRQVLAAANA